jgi:PAS domain S-box-containing protein
MNEMSPLAHAADFHVLFEATPNLHLILDPELRIVAATDAYCRATLTVRDEIVGRALFDVFPDNPNNVGADGERTLRASLRRVLTTRRPDALVELKYAIERPDGSGFEDHYWTLLNSPVLDAAGEVRWIINTVEDVTGNVRKQLDLKAQADSFRESSSFFDTVIENIPAMIAVKDAKDLRFVLLNRTGEELTGIPRDESLGKNDFDMFPREQAEFFVAQDRAVLESGTLKVIAEEPIQTRTHGVRYLTTYKMPVFDEQGQPKYLLAMSNDITEQKRAAEALKSSEGKFASLMAASPDAVLAVDATGKIVLANDRVRETFGYEPGELIGRIASTISPVSEETRERITRAMAAPEGKGARIVQDLEGLRKDGTHFPMEASFGQHQSPDGIMVMIAVRDVTARKSVESQLRQAQKMEAIGNLTGGLAHDFNNLLSVVIGNLDLLREELTKGSSLDELANEALMAALRGAELTRRLLAFARRQPLQPKVIDVGDLIDGVSKLLSRTLGTNIEIALKPGSGVWPVLADPVQLEACLVNLAANARDAMPKGGSLQIATDNRHLDEDYVGLYPGLAAGDYTLIEVTDTGTGIPKDVLDKIFEPFFTTKSEGKGTGLGLSMVFGFMKQSNGHINVYSEPNVGTTFRLYLPRAMTAAEVAGASEPANFALGAAETILAVEDNPRLRALVVRQLKQLGYRTLEAEDGPSAIKVLETNDVDLLFSDVIMPGGMSGYDLGRVARTRWPSIRVLLTSGFPEEKINGNGQPPWNMRLLLKPYRKEDLALILREVLAETSE